jgi:hypothetical protein
VFTVQSDTALVQPQLTMVDTVVDLATDLGSDSVPLMAIDTVEALVELPVTSLFTDHLLQPQNGFEFLLRTDPANTFGFIVLLFCCASIIYLQRSYQGFFSNVFKASFDRTLSQQDARLENSQRTRNIMLLQFTALVSISLFITFMIPLYLETELAPIALFIMAFAGITTVVVIKRMVLWSLAQIFDLQPELRIHRFSSAVLLSMTGLVLLPLSLVLHYSPYISYGLVVYTAVALAGFFYLKVLFRGFLLALSSKSISVLHLFYYFCALEILPVFVLIRVVQNL